jgi:predicted transcriptional regulator
MTVLTLEVPPDLYERLRQEAERAGRPVETLIEEWLSQRFPPPAAGERARAREVLRAAGLLTELGPELKQRAAQATATPEEIQAAFARAGGKPLSEIVIEQRGPKV